jgi:hypothetical protein
MSAGLATPFSDVLDVEVLWHGGSVDGDGLLGLFQGDEEKKWVRVCVVVVVVVTTSVVVVVSAIIKRESADSL